MADLAERVRDLATACAGSGLGVLQAVCRHGGIEWHLFDSAGRQSSSTPELIHPVQALEKALRPAGQDRPLVMELRLDGSGGFEFRHTFELASVSPSRVIMDPEYRHPRHPRPGMAAPAGAGVIDRPTEPAVLATVRDLVDEYVARYTEIKGRAPDFGSGYSEEEILAAERAMGLRLPEDVRALYRLVHDDLREHGLLGVQELLPLDAVVKEYLAGVPGSYGWNDDLFAVTPVVFETWPAGRVRRVSRSDWWVTIATDRSGDWCAVDLDPAPDGTPGQLIDYGRNVLGQVGYVAESVTAVLRQVVTALRAGAYTDHDPDEPYLALAARFGGSTEVPYVESFRVGDRPAAAVVAGLDDPLAIQQLYLNDAVALDLADLTPLRNLRALSVHRAGSVGLALPQDLPVESLKVDATAADPALLAGHPTLWQLTLKGLAEPLSVEPLATLPALSCLDLSTVEVTDLERVAALPGLRVLALNRRQWQYLRDRDALPSVLAAAELSDQTSLREAIDWAAALHASLARYAPGARAVRGTLM